eukprot:118565-Chlamydomonas_euryale.AAC.3
MPGWAAQVVTPQNRDAARVAMGVRQARSAGALAWLLCWPPNISHVPSPRPRGSLTLVDSCTIACNVVMMS